MAGCGGSRGGMFPQAHIEVSLAIARIEVSQSGMPVSVAIQIESPSETALVAVTGLPAGCSVMYSASDTNPSGILQFMANTTSPIGNYMPVVTVNSAGQMASTQFTLVVKSATGM